MSPGGGGRHCAWIWTQTVKPEVYIFTVSRNGQAKRYWERLGTSWIIGYEVGRHWPSTSKHCLRWELQTSIPLLQHNGLSVFAGANMHIYFALVRLLVFKIDESQGKLEYQGNEPHYQYRLLSFFLFFSLPQILRISFFFTVIFLLCKYDPRFASSNPAEGNGFWRDIKSMESIECMYEKVSRKVTFSGIHRYTQIIVMW